MKIISVYEQYWKYYLLQIYNTIQNKMHINLCWPLRVFFFFFFINIALEVNFLLNWASIGVVIFVCFHAFISRCTLYLLNSFHSWFVNENLHILFYGLSQIIPVTCISLISRQWTFLTLVFFSVKTFGNLKFIYLCMDQIW